MDDQKITFSFGQNWISFLDSMGAESLKVAAGDIQQWLGVDGAKGKRVLDIGSGSGIHSLCFHDMKAAEVISVDVDPKSVEATRRLWSRAGEPANWRVMHGSVLDQQFLPQLGTFDLVYSWGVLHHTGAMWDAIAGACSLVAPHGGKLWIAIYAGGGQYPYDLALKQRYNRASSFGKKRMEWKWIRGLMYRRLRSGQNPFNWNQKKERGMDVYHDIVDWLGGLPYEVATVSEIVEFCKAQGFAIEKIDEQPEGCCSIYLFSRS